MASSVRHNNRASSAQRAPPGAVVPVFAALGDETRLRVVARLTEEGPLSIAKLTEGSHLTRQAMTKHLRVLSAAGLLRGRREGRENVFEFEPRRLAEARGYLARISEHWDATLERLRAFVEDE